MGGGWALHRFILKAPVPNLGGVFIVSLILGHFLAGLLQCILQEAALEDHPEIAIGNTTAAGDFY